MPGFPPKSVENGLEQPRGLLAQLRCLSDAHQVGEVCSLFDWKSAENRLSFI